MRNIYLVVFSALLLIPSLSYAQSSITMRSLAESQLFLYGQSVYERGDYPEASRIFSKILQMNPNNSEALNYATRLKSKGQNVFIPPTAIVAPPIVSVKKVMVGSQAPVEADSNQDLKDALTETDKNIEKVTAEISDLSTQMNKE